MRNMSAYQIKALLIYIKVYKDEHIPKDSNHTTHKKK